MKLFQLYESVDQISWEDDPVFIFHELVSYYKEGTQDDEMIRPIIRRLESKLIHAATASMNEKSTHTSDLFAYAIHVKKTRWKTIEPLFLMISLQHSIHYAVKVLKQRWPKLEKQLVIKGSEKLIKEYAQELKNENLIDAHEATKLRDDLIYQVNQSKTQAVNESVEQPRPELTVADNIWPTEYEGKPPLEVANIGIMFIERSGTRSLSIEHIILNDPIAAVRYAAHGLQSRWKTAEPIIAQNTEASMLYAKNVVKGRFKLGESAIAKDPHASLSYAKTIKSRFPKGEECMSDDETVWIRYKNFLRENKIT